METAELTKKEYYTTLSEQMDGAYTTSELAVIQQNVAKGTNAVELAYFLNVCKSMELNPFNKEVWCYKDQRGNLLIFSGRDGFLAKAQKHPMFNGMRSSEVCENDEIEIDIPNGKIHHKINPKEKRGAVIGSYTFVFRKDGEPTIEWADFDSYNKGYNTWKTHPAEMIKKVSESHALKKAFGISGIQSEYEFSVENNVATPISHEIKKPSEEMVRAQVFIKNAKSKKELENLEDTFQNTKLKLDEETQAMLDDKKQSLTKKSA